jgi:glycosyltransferase involved in cell wall biosynthesis
VSSSVSVVIPAYNAEATISQAVASAFDQTVAPQEVIVACDGCTDATAELAKKAGARVLELKKANGSVARNKGVAESSGSFVFFLDADDWWEREKVAAHLAAWSDRDCSFVIDRAVPWMGENRAYWTGGISQKGDAEWTAFLSHRAWASGSSFSVTRSNYDQVGGFNENLNKFQDVDFWVRCAHDCGPAYCLGEPFTNYRLSESSTVSKTTSRLEENLAALFAGWHFVSSEQKESFASHAYLTAAEVTPWPASVDLFKKAHWPVTRRFFWKSLFQSLRRTA